MASKKKTTKTAEEAPAPEPTPEPGFVEPVARALKRAAEAEEGK